MINIISTPQNWMPVGNPICLTVSSDQIGQCNFRYVADLNIINSNTGTVEVTRRFNLFPNALGFATFDFSKTLEDYVGNELAETGLPFTGVTGQSNFKAYTIDVYEAYDITLNCSGDVVVNNASLVQIDGTNSKPLIAFYGRLTKGEWESVNDFETVYKLQNGNSKFLTFSPRVIPVNLSDRYKLSFLYSNSPTNPTTLRVTPYDLQGVQMPFVNIPIVIPNVLSSVFTGMASIGVGPCDIQDILGQTTGFVLLSEYVSKYEVRLLSGLSNKSEIFTFKIQKDLINNNIKQLFFVNRLGGTDAISITANETIDSSQTDFRPVNQSKDSGFKYTENDIDSLQLSLNQTVTGITPALTKSYYDFLSKEIMVSPKCVLQDRQECLAVTKFSQFIGQQAYFFRECSSDFAVLAPQKMWLTVQALPAIDDVIESVIWNNSSNFFTGIPNQGLTGDFNGVLRVLNQTINRERVVITKASYTNTAVKNYIINLNLNKAGFIV